MATDTILSAAFGGLFIGLSAVLLLALTGRIAGVSGFVSRLLPPYSDNQLPVRLAFVAGLVIAPLLYAAATGIPVGIEVTSSLPLLVIGGVLVGFGAVRGGGCTSGHGICGTARLSPRSIAATAIFMTTGAITVFIMRHVLGG
ncbi:YeeE/YedE family protein [Hyphomicrobium sp. NDB2Meth4]|uniref:YeeE/YedE family protein n=1 Tax=Hyphomicrobium sp. NDB2Meth4 TaxID=1892846 RepID=UPI00092FDD4A|nr:YeeE/YedE family protein [Hyphomicrobium sp. NDB2Meth4]